MPPHCFDTSALGKRYHEEKGTDAVDAIREDETTEIISSSLAIIESVSAFRRKHNRGDLTEEELHDVIAAFFREALSEFVIVSMAESMSHYSFELILDDTLRTLDSLQLSAGLAIDAELDTAIFVTADRDLAVVAENRGLQTIVPD